MLISVCDGLKLEREQGEDEGHQKTEPADQSPEDASSWVNRHAAFVGVSGFLLLRHFQVDVPEVRILDLTLTSRQAVCLADGFRSPPHLIRSLTQLRHGKTYRGLVAINRPSQVCRLCARAHEANPITRGAQLRSWMEGWRVSCPVCGTALEDYRLYMRLFRADPADPWLRHNAVPARAGETMIDRATRQGRGEPHARLMRGLLAFQASNARRNSTSMPRLLDLVVDGSEDFL